MEKPNFTGNQAQKVIHNLSRVADVLFCEELDQEPKKDKDAIKTRMENATKLKKWKSLANNQLKLWSLLEQHHDYSDEDLDKLHYCSNQFIDQWLDLLGDAHMTNYIHVIGSGHVTFFAKKYNNLYRYSQQGWESLNQLIKHFYFNNTNHGGSAGNGGKNSVGQYVNGTISGDHCRPLMRLCQRSMMWKLGLADAYFQHAIIDKKKNIDVIVDTSDDEGTDEYMEVDENNEIVKNMEFGEL
jgi:hypothetical protein